MRRETGDVKGEGEELERTRWQKNCIGQTIRYSSAKIKWIKNLSLTVPLVSVEVDVSQPREHSCVSWKERTPPLGACCGLKHKERTTDEHTMTACCSCGVVQKLQQSNLSWNDNVHTKTLAKNGHQSHERSQEQRLARSDGLPRRLRGRRMCAGTWQGGYSRSFG